MPTFEFQAPLDANGSLPVPPQLAEQLGRGKTIRVILVVDDPDEDADWARLTHEQFFRGYEEDDKENKDGPIPAG